jgi:uncharacterized protein (DUF1684 family)
MKLATIVSVFLTGLLVGCTSNRWPDPPAIDQAKYQAGHATWLADQDELVSEVLPIVGIWPLAEGETAFGADTDLPIVLPAAATGRAGVFRRQGTTITVVPAAGADLRTSDGRPIDSALEVDGDLRLGSLRMYIAGAGDGRLWVTASDEQHPAVRNPPVVEAYPLDPRWRIAARFEAFDLPKPMRVPDVRGGTMDFTAMGQLVFRVNGQEMRLTALGEPGSEQFFVMFKDPTNEKTTYRGYRILSPAVVATGEWTVVDFNYASNPPCAYSRYTVCPLPPPENRLPVAVEAGLKRLPSAQGYSPS